MLSGKIFMSSDPTSDTGPTGDANQLSGLSSAKQMRCKAECEGTPILGSQRRNVHRCIYATKTLYTDFMVSGLKLGLVS